MKMTLLAAAVALIPLAGVAADGQKQPATPAGQSGSFDTLDATITPSTRLVLRTDAAPFRLLVDGPVPHGAAPAKARP